jgi:serine-protein kinase ATM
MPFGDFIVDKTSKPSNSGQSTYKVGAHSRYYPNEWSSDLCRGKLIQLWKKYHERDNVGNEENDKLDHQKNLRDTFDTINKNHSPVFRYFFVEKFLNPEIWYASKMRYTRSVAVSSVVGHILGIGKLSLLPGFYIILFETYSI